MSTPEQITTPEELDALPVGAVVMENDDGDFLGLPTVRGVFHRFPRACWGDSDGWFVVAGHHGRKSSEIELPATVLYRPDAAPVEPRTLPTEVEVARLIEPEAYALSDLEWHDDYGRTTSVTRSLEERGYVRRAALSRARAVLALFAAQPTVAQAKAEVLREMADAWYDDDSGAHWDDWPLVNDAPLLCRTSEEGRDWLRFHADRIEKGEGER